MALVLFGVEKKNLFSESTPFVFETKSHTKSTECVNVQHINTRWYFVWCGCCVVCWCVYLAQEIQFFRFSLTLLRSAILVLLVSANRFWERDFLSLRFCVRYNKKKKICIFTNVFSSNAHNCCWFPQWNTQIAFHFTFTWNVEPLMFT